MKVLARNESAEEDNYIVELSASELTKIMATQKGRNRKYKSGDSLVLPNTYDELKYLAINRQKLLESASVMKDMSDQIRKLIPEKE